MNEHGTVTFNVRITDRRALRRAALEKAVKDMPAHVWRDMRKGREREADLIMLLDPGPIPLEWGIEIEDTDADTWRLEDIPLPES